MSGNLYYNPEDHGLTILGDVGIAGSYEFDMLVVWKRDEDGALFYNFDSGCSCPSPFEDAYDVGHLMPITDAAAFAREARAWVRGTYGGVSPDARDSVERIIRQVQRRMRKVVAS